MTFARSQGSSSGSVNPRVFSWEAVILEAFAFEPGTLRQHSTFVSMMLAR